MIANDSDQSANFKAISFDCYGTLIDWETGLLEALDPWRQRSAISESDEDLLQRFAHWESEIEHHNPELIYPAVLRNVCAEMTSELGAAASENEIVNFGSSVGRWPAFDDSAAALQRLQTKFQLVILSNVDRNSFAQSEQKLGVNFDFVFVAEDIGTYKPDANNFHYLLERLQENGISKSQLLHAGQSLFHDIQPAIQLGINNIWIDRRSENSTGSGATATVDGEVQPDRKVRSLAEFADLMIATTQE